MYAAYFNQSSKPVCGGNPVVVSAPPTSQMPPATPSKNEVVDATPGHIEPKGLTGQKASRRQLVREVHKSKVFSLTEEMPRMGIPPVRTKFVYPFTHMAYYPAFLTSSTITETDMVAYFKLNELTGYAALTAVFDQYRIVEIEIWIIPRMSVNSTGTVNPGRLLSVIDYDDITAVTISDALQYSNCMVSIGTQGHYRSFKPAVRIYNDSSTGMIVSAPWIDCTNYDTVHRGIKMCISATSEELEWDFAVRYSVEFRNSR